LPLKRPPLVYKHFKNDEDKESENQNSIKLNSNLNDEKLNWKRSVTTGLNGSICVKFDAKEKQFVIDSFHSIKEVKIMYAKVVQQDQTYQLDDLKREFKFEDFESKYALECLASQFEHVLIGKVDRKFTNLLNKCVDSKMVCRCIESLTLDLDRKRFRDLFKLFEEVLSEYRDYSLVSDDPNCHSLLVGFYLNFYSLFKAIPNFLV
jgi:hypothetical protein